MDNDLKWLAENVHEWLKYGDVKYIALDCDGEICFYGECGDEFNFYPHYVTDYKPGNQKRYTREEWQAARDELSGKPKEWEGEWLAQNSGGEWASFDGGQKPKPCHERGYYGTKKGFLKHYGRGCVLGDWRDTLEHRPKSVETEQKQWRGPEDGFPPVGLRVQLHNDEGFGLRYMHDYIGNEVEFKAGFKGNRAGTDMVVIEADDGSCGCFRLSMIRPTQTEEDKQVTEIRDVVYGEGCVISESAARILYKAGYRNNQKLLSELYQVLGELGAPKNVLDHIDAAQMGEKLPYDTLLPFIGSDK